jgi:hypothetical protein
MPTVPGRYFVRPTPTSSADCGATRATLATDAEPDYCNTVLFGSDGAGWRDARPDQDLCLLLERRRYRAGAGAQHNGLTRPGEQLDLAAEQWFIGKTGDSTGHLR